MKSHAARIPKAAPKAASAKTAAAALPRPAHDRLRRSFGPEIDSVRLHTRAGAHALLGNRPAAAYGQDIYFAPGQFRPETLAGELLLAHELAHALQQRGEGPRSDASHELAADEAALMALLGLSAPAPRRAGLSLARCSASYDVNAPENRERVDRLARLFRRQDRALARGASRAELDAIDRDLQRELDQLPSDVRSDIRSDPANLREARRRILQASTAGQDDVDPAFPLPTSLDDAIAALQRQPWNRDELRRRVTEAVDGYRSQWEQAQPLQVGDVPREQAWQRWREARIRIAVGDEAAPLGPLAELGDVTWEPDRTDGLLIVYGAAGIGFAASRGRLFRLRNAPVVPGGATGPTPAHTRPGSPFLGVAGVGDQGLSIVRLPNGDGLLLDVSGNASALPMQHVAALQAEMRIGDVIGIGLTHMHEDHAAYDRLVEFILRHRIGPDQLRVSAAWLNHPILQRLLSPTDPTSASATALRLLGYRAGAAFGTVPVPAAGPMEGRIQLRGGQFIRYFGDPQAQRAYQATTPTSRADAASLMYVIEGATTNRVLFLQDVRGQTVSAIRQQMEAARPGSFNEALEGVRVIQGFGHHFGLAAGTSPANVAGMNDLIRAAIRNGELTIVVQTTEAVALQGGTSPLLEYARGLGARVILVTDPGDFVLNDRLQVQLQGQGVLVFEGNPTARLAAQRMAELREAMRTVRTEGELGVRQLGLGDRPVAQVQDALRAELNRLETLYGELADRLGIDLANATRAARGQSPMGARATATALGGRPMPRSEQAIRTELNRPGGPELSPEVRQALRRAASLGSTLSIEAELGLTPRSVADVVRDVAGSDLVNRIEARYRRLTELSQRRGSQELSREQRLIAHAEVEGLIDELQQRQGQLPEEQRVGLNDELDRLRTLRDSFGVEVQRTVQRGADGTVRTTEFRTARGYERARAQRAVGAVGRAIGAVMVVHSISGLQHTGEALREGDVTLPQGALQIARDAMGVRMGVRMIAARHVGVGSLVVYAMLDIGAAMAGEYETSEERDVAVYGAAIRQGIGAICMIAGQAVVDAGVVAPTHPLIKGLLIGLGFGIMLGGPAILEALGLSGYIVDWFSFPPAEVTRVHRRIGELLDRYEVMIGARALLDRPASELAALGTGDAARLRQDALDTVAAERVRADALEDDIVTLFEEAYPRARTSFFGLRPLDVLSARFARLRHLARGGGPGGTGSAAEAAIEARFQSIQQGLDMSGMSVDDIRHLEQWDELDERLDDALVDQLGTSSSDVNWHDLAEEVREVESMIESARYRLHPASQGSERATPLLREGTAARAAYEEELARRERRLATVIDRLSTMGGTATFAADPSPTAEAPATATRPSDVLLRLLRMRDQSRALIQEGRQAHPELAAVAGWSNPPDIAAALRRAHAADPGLFRRIRATEMALGLAASQARSSRAQLGADATGLGPRFDEALREARELPDRRRIEAGLVLPDELDSRLREQTRLHHQELAVHYFGAPADVTALRPEEVRALGSGLLAESGRTVSSPSRQLDVVLDDPRRALGGEVIAVFRLPARIQVSGGARRPPVARTITETNALVATSGQPVVEYYERSTIQPLVPVSLLGVVPINAEAVRALGGRGEVRVAHQLTPLIPVRRTDVPQIGP